ncbi:MFS transporter [Actinomadura vinacea]
MIIGLASGQFLATLSTTVIATALPTISGDLGGGQSHVSWIASTTLLAATIAGPIMGKLADVLGRRRVFVVTALLYVTGAAIAGTSTGTGRLIAGLAVQGVGIGGLLVMTQVLLGDLATPRERGRYIGYIVMGYGTAAVSGPLIGGHLVGLGGSGWRLCFLGAVPLAVLVCGAVLRGLPTSDRRPGRSVDVAGMIGLGGTTVCLLLIVTFGGRTIAWSAPETAALAAAALAFTALLVRSGRTAPDPVLPARLIRSRPFLICAAASMVTSGVLYVALFLLPQYMQIVQGVSPARSGMLMLPLLLCQIVTTPLVGAALSRFGVWKPFALTGASLIFAGALLLAAGSAAAGTILLPAAMGLLGIGMGSTAQILMVVAQMNARAADLGITTSMITFARSFGAATGVAVVGAIVTARVADLLPGRLAEAGIAAPDRAGAAGLIGAPESVSALPAPVRQAIAETYAAAFHDAFSWSLVVIAAAPALIALARGPRLPGGTT